MSGTRTVATYPSPIATHYFQRFSTCAKMTSAIVLVALAIIWLSYGIAYKIHWLTGLSGAGTLCSGYGVYQAYQFKHLQDFETSNRQLEEHVSNLRDQNTQFENNNQELSAEISALHLENSRLNEETNRLTEQNTEFENNNHQLTERISSLGEEISQLHGENDRLHLQNTQFANNNLQLNEHVSSLSAEISQMNGENTRLNEETTRLTEQNTLFENNNRQLSAQVTTLDTKISQLNHENEHLNTQISQLTEQNSQFENHNQELKERISAFNEMIAQLNTENTKLNQEARSLQAHNSQLMQTVQEFQHLLQSSTETNQKQETLIIQLQEEIKKLEDLSESFVQKTSTHVAQLQNLSTSLGGIQESAASNHQIFGENVNKFAQYIDRLSSSQMDEQTQALIDAGKVLKETFTLIQKWKDNGSVSKEIDNMEKLQAQCNNLNLQLKERNEEVLQTAQKLSNIEGQITQLNEHLIDLGKTKEGFKVALQSLLEKIDQLRVENTNLSTVKKEIYEAAQIFRQHIATN